MKPKKDLITFVIAVKHYAHIHDLPEFTWRFQQTVASIAQQKAGLWRCVVVVNQGMELPELPEGFEVVFVDLPPNPYFDMSKYDKELCYNAIREDKGRKVLAGLLSAPESDYFMVVDDDDFLHQDLVAFIEANDNEKGWMIDKGYIWYENTPFLLKRDNFHHLCGTSNIIFREALEIEKNQEDLDFIKSYLGSHVSIQEKMQTLNKPLESLPFRGAIYRMGHSGAHSRIMQSKWVFLKRLLSYKFRVTWLTKRLKTTYAMDREL